jgi:hypothetical protein
MESSQIGDLTFSINILKERLTNTFISLAINANTSNSKWTLIQFNILAESRSEI